ncbi:MAG: hypothetical protein GY711_08690 [bacterium]|nr:hypothetical protein [bacterium]
MLAAVAASLLATCAQDASAGAGDAEPKVLLVFIDGFLPGAITVAETPALDRLLEHAAWSLRARAESTTISGSGWSSFVNGVHWDKHGVPNNEFKTPHFDLYPHVLQRFKEARPEGVTASAQSWKPIQDGLALPAKPDHVSFHDYYADADDYWDEPSADAKCANDMVRFLGEPALDAAVIMFGELDGVGHSDGNKNYHAGSELYRKMLAKVDGHLGRLLDAIEARASYPREDWLVIVSADHAGAQGEGHGKNTPAHREIPFLVSGPSAHPGEIWPPPKTPDVAVTALAHLGVGLDPRWKLDGRAVGLAPSVRPTVRLGGNLIFNGDAEYERAQIGTPDRLDVSIAGWEDPGWMTVHAHASPSRDSGRNFFAGGYGRKDAVIRQTIDVTALAGAIDGGATYELSAYVGGVKGGADSASVAVRFQGANGDEVGTAQLERETAFELGRPAGLLRRSVSGAVPAGTRSVVVEVTAHAENGKNDGAADELSLVLRQE